MVKGVESGGLISLIRDSIVSHTRKWASSDFLYRQFLNICAFNNVQQVTYVDSFIGKAAVNRYTEKNCIEAVSFLLTDGIFSCFGNFYSNPLVSLWKFYILIFD